MNKTFGCCRLVYNLHLAERNKYWEDNKSKPQAERSAMVWTTEKHLKEQHPFLKEVSSVALQQSRIDCDKAFDNWFKSIKGIVDGNFKHPKFKSKHSNNFSYREQMVREDAFDFDHRVVLIPKLKEVKFKLRKHPQFKVLKVKNMTIRKKPSGRYFASILCEVEEFKQAKPMRESQAYVGLDWSPKDMFVTSDGLTGKDFGYKALKQINGLKLHKLQKRLMKKVKGSKNKDKARVKVARLEEHTANARKAFTEASQRL